MIHSLALGLVGAGDKVDVALLPDGRVELVASDSGHDLSKLRGMLRRPNQEPVSLEAMREAIATGRRR